MEELVVEGLEYSDIVFLRDMLQEKTFCVDDYTNILRCRELIDRLQLIIDAFD